MKKALLGTVIFSLLAFATYIGAGEKLVWDFEETDVGKVPSGWKVEATKPRGEIATWKVVSDTRDGKKTKALGMTGANDDYGGTFNICWTDGVRFKDGTIEVSFKALEGVEDQGGGGIWRVQDANNYYIARANPLENNFRLYYVKNGKRKTLDSAKVKVPANRWHTIMIIHKRDRIEGYLNGEKLLQDKDSTLPEEGGVGVWTKADAATNFDDFKVTSSNQE